MVKAISTTLKESSSCNGQPGIKRANAPGFTIIEFVIVTVVISILAVVAVSRFLGSNSFNAFIIRDQIISLTRTAQQSSLGRADVTLTISAPTSDSLTVTTAAGGATITEVDLDLDGVTITGDVNTTDSCATTPATAITSAPVFQVNFDELGDLDDSGFFGSEAAVNSAVRICLNDSVVDSVCISPAGFAYAGDCDV